MIKLPENVQRAIDAYKEEEKKNSERARDVQRRNTVVAEELAKAQAELDAATDRAIDSPTEANVRKETEARRKVAELTLQANGSDHRAQRAFAYGQDKLNELGRQAIALAHDEAVRYYNENYEAKLKEIEDAKVAYLKALVGFRQFRNEAAAIYYDTVRETNPHLTDRLSAPHFAEPAITHRNGDKQVYGINEQEVDLAFRNGIIRKWSVRSGLETE